jgi:MFS family permease
MPPILLEDAAPPTASALPETPPHSPAQRGPQLPYGLRAFRHPNYRLFFFGQILSLIGTWMQSTAQQWLVYRLTDSQTSLGLVTFLGFLPVLLFSLFMGVLADRLPKRSLLVFTQLWFTLMAAILAWLTFTGRIQYGHILLLAFLSGIANALDMPTRQAFQVELVGREDVPGAIGLNSAMFNSARIIGPAVGGVIVGALGEAPAFAINAVSFLPVIIGLLLMRLTPAPQRASRQTGLSDLKQGLVYMLGEARIFGLVGMVALFSFIAGPYLVLLPVFARDVLGSGAQGFGQLMAAQGAGALIGAVGIIFFGERWPKGRVILACRGLLGFAVAGLALSRDPRLSVAALVVAGFAFVTQMILTNTLIQLIVPDGLRGRVMSAYTWALGGFYPLGSILVGLIGDRIGAPNAALLIAGGAILLALLNLLIFPQMRRL